MNYRTGFLNYHTDFLNYHTDFLNYHTDFLNYHADFLNYHTEFLNYRTDFLNYWTRKGFNKVEKIEFKHVKTLKGPLCEKKVKTCSFERISTKKFFLYIF